LPGSEDFSSFLVRNDSRFVSSEHLLTGGEQRGGVIESGKVMPNLFHCCPVNFRFLSKTIL